MDRAREHSLKKYEILRGSATVSKLFSSARSFRGKFIKALFTPLEMELEGSLSLPKVLFVAGRKNTPDAVDRNRIKRLMKEAYRHEKQLAVECAAKYRGKGSRTLCIAFVYTGRYKTLPSSHEFREEIKTLLETIRSMSPG